MLNRDGRWLIKVLQTARGVTLLSLAVRFQATSQRIAALTPTTVGSEDLQDAANADCIHGCRGPCRRGIWSQALAERQRHRAERPGDRHRRQTVGIPARARPTINLSQCC
jgi:hypothetical protein